jgi:hypothetical protein
MGHDRLSARRAQDETPSRAPSPAASPQDPRLAALVLGNARFGALLRALDAPAGPQPHAFQRSRSVALARTLDGALPTVLPTEGGNITVGSVRAFKSAVVGGWQAMLSDDIQVSFVDVNVVQDRLTAADDAFTKLEAAANVASPASPDAASLTKAQAAKKEGPLGAHVFGVVSNLVAAAKLINTGYEEWKTQFAPDEAPEAGPEEVPEWQRFAQEKKEKTAQEEQAKKEKQWAAEAERAEKGSKSEEEKESEGPASFPHGGKHQPPPRLMTYPDNLRDQGLVTLTGKPKAVALYKSNLPETVIAWEEEAMTSGLTLNDEFTILYAFGETIGADGGEMTRFVRCEGHHHGHPLRQEGATSFNDYMRKEVELAQGDLPRLEELRAFLRKINVPAAQFRL